MFDVFISYSAQDRDWTSNLAVKISKHEYRGRKLRVWFDDWSIEPGTFFRKEIEHGIENSRIMLVILSNAATKSDWVELERYLFQAGDPLGRRKKLIPILISDCTIPAAYSSLNYMDFRDHTKFERYFQKLISIICDSKKTSTEHIEKELSTLVANTINNKNTRGPTAEKDALLHFIKQFDVNTIDDEGIVKLIFNFLIETNVYDVLLMAAEAIAYLTVNDPKYNIVLQQLADDDKTNSDLMIARAYSKIAELRPHMVDTSCLLYLSSKLDSKSIISVQEEGLRAHIARAFGKIRHTDPGVRSIEALLQKGDQSRWIALGAITVNLDKAVPIFDFTASKELFSSSTLGQPPGHTLVRIMKQLLNTLKGGLRREGQSMVRAFFKSWPELQNIYDNYSDDYIRESDARTLDLDVIWKTVGDVEWGSKFPFTGEFLFVNEKNWEDIRYSLTPSSVVCFDSDAWEHCYSFSGAAGFLFHDINVLCHIATNLRNDKVPFASLQYLPGDTPHNRIFNTDLIIPNGASVFVDHSGLKVIKDRIQDTNEDR